MKKTCWITSLALLYFFILFPLPAGAAPFSSMIGDNDGYGFGVMDNGTAVWPGLGPNGTNYDGRDPAEAAASNGAQFTDVFSALLPPPFGPNLSEAGDVIFPLAGSLNSATLTIDMGDNEASFFGPITVSFNGIVQTDLFNFDDGPQITVVRDFVLDASAINAANLAGQFVLGLDRDGVGDFIAFDYFKLEGDVTSTVIPEPATMLLLGTGLVGLAAAGRRKLFKKS